MWLFLSAPPPGGARLKVCPPFWAGAAGCSGFVRRELRRKLSSQGRRGTDAIARNVSRLPAKAPMMIQSSHTEPARPRASNSAPARTVLISSGHPPDNQTRIPLTSSASDPANALSSHRSTQRSTGSRGGDHFLSSSARWSRARSSECLRVESISLASAARPGCLSSRTSFASRASWRAM